MVSFPIFWIKVNSFSQNYTICLFLYQNVMKLSNMMSKTTKSIVNKPFYSKIEEKFNKNSWKMSEGIKYRVSEKMAKLKI